MAAHLAHAARTRRWGALCVAIGVGLAVFAVVDGERGSETVPGRAASSPTSPPTVLGSIVTAPPPEALADPATPATFDLRASAVTPPTRRARAPREEVSSTTSTSVAQTTTTTTGPELIPPMTIENTTTTTESPTTTEPTTTSTTESTGP
jgi:hypothetical protein